MNYFKGTILFCSLFIIPNWATSQVFTTDVVVQGSICIGIDCATSESFGFDTQRFKENNLRIHFDDTSASGSFPANDWRIIINDSDNGGQNYFGVDDATAGNRPFQIDAGSGANALKIDASGGNIGMGTATPVVELHIADGDSPTLRLEQNNANGWTPQTWDIAGNETNFFIRDVTNGSKLPFKIKPGAPDNAIFIQADGGVGIGTAADQSAKLYVNGNLTVNGDILALSDRRIKKDINDLKYGLSEILKLSSKQYNFTGEQYKNLNLSKNLQLGLIAQEVQSIIPEIVVNDINAKNVNGEINYLKGVNYTALIPVLIHAIQEQQQLITAKDSEIEAIKTQLYQINAKVDALLAQESVGSTSNPSSIDTTKRDDQLNTNARIAPKVKPQAQETLNNGRSKKEMLKYNKTENQ